VKDIREVRLWHIRIRRAPWATKGKTDSIAEDEVLNRNLALRRPRCSRPGLDELWSLRRDLRVLLDTLNGDHRLLEGDEAANLKGNGIIEGE
jgi:hypothetical protein